MFYNIILTKQLNNPNLRLLERKTSAITLNKFTNIVGIFKYTNGKAVVHKKEIARM